MKFLFIIAVILTACVTVMSLRCVKSSGKKKNPQAVYFIGIFMLIIGLMDISGIIDIAEFHGVFFFCGIVQFLEIILAWLYTFFLEKNTSGKSFISFAMKVITVASVLELSLFNMSSYHLWLGDYNEKSLFLNDAEISGGDTVFNADDEILDIKGKDEVLITYNNLGQQVGTLKAEVEFGKNTKTADIIVDITDATHDTYRYDIAKMTAVNENQQSMIMPCQFSGDVGTFRVKFTMNEEYDSLTLKSLTINAPIPFDIQYIRWFGIIFISLFVYILINGIAMKMPFYQNKSFCNAFAAVYTIICVVSAVKLVTFNSDINTIDDWKGQFQLTYGNQISQEIVDAFEAGQVSLLDEVEPELLELENPYDWGQRGSNHVEYKWDHVMYNGKYYSYYGIAPVILLFLPYHMLTGYYFSTNLAVLLFGIIGIIFLTMTYMAFIRKFFWKVSTNMVLCGLIIIQTASGIWYSIGRTLFYEISISSGFAFVTIGAYFLITSNIIGLGRVSFPRVALSSFFLATAVLCRPTLAVYCMAACLFYFFGLSKSGTVIQNVENGAVYAKSKNKMFAYIVCALLPMFALAAVQMYYNYIRFDSPLDFGIQYSLTINDFTNAQYHTHFVLIGLYNYLFAVPSFELSFPFISTPFTKLDVNGYYFSDVGNVSGILFMSLPVFAYIFSRKAYGLADVKNRRKNALLIGVTCVLMPLVIICSVWESGYAVRYIADFAWQITIGALAIIFTLYMKNDNQQVKGIFEKFMVFAVLWGFAVNIPQIFSFSLSAEKFPELYCKLADIFEFWR